MISRNGREARMNVRKILNITCLCVLSFAFLLLASGCAKTLSDEALVGGTYLLAANGENSALDSLSFKDGAWTAKSADKSINGTFLTEENKISLYKTDGKGKNELYAYAFIRSREWLRVYPVTENRVTMDFTRSGTLPVGANAGVPELKYNLSEDGAFYSVTSADGSYGEVTVPSEHDGKPVKEIAKLAFYRCLDVVRVVLPDTVEKIDDEAFRGCESLYAVNAGKNLSFIGKKAFYGCESLKFFSADNVKTISDQAFYGADVSNFSLSGQVEFIGEEAFYSTNIITVSVPETTSYIGTRAFANCLSIDKIFVDENNKNYSSYGEDCIVEKARKIMIAGCAKTVLPTEGNVKIIGEGAMSGARTITSIVFPAEITEIRRGAFENCKSIESIFYLGTSPKDWLAIKKTSNNVKFFRANVYIYSENEPALNEKKDGYAKKDGYNCTFWRYVGGKPALWRFTEEHPPEKNK